jgi:hypothetical protein
MSTLGQSAQTACGSKPMPSSIGDETGPPLATRDCAIQRSRSGVAHESFAVVALESSPDLWCTPS